MIPEQLQDELDQLRTAYRVLQRTLAQLNSEIAGLQAEIGRLNHLAVLWRGEAESLKAELDRLQAAPVIDEMALAIAAGQAGFDWQDNEVEQ